MLFKRRNEAIGKTLVKSKPLLIQPSQGYVRPREGKDWWSTTTTVWRVDEIIRRRVRDWRRLLGEDGHTGERAETFRKDHDSVYTGSHSVFPAPLMEFILARYCPEGGRVLDAFAGGPPRGVISSIMGHEYVGFDVRQAQIDENEQVLDKLGLAGAEYVLGDGRWLRSDIGQFDVAVTCPPYHDLEKYSDQDDDISNCGSYEEFRAMIALSAEAHLPLLKPGAFACWVVGPFRSKRTGELIDFPGHVTEDFREAGFVFWQSIVLSKNFASAAKRSTNAWRGKKLVPCHEFLLVFRKPEVT